MVGVGIGAGVIIVIIEVIYYRRKGMRKEQRNIAVKCAEQWKATTAEAKRKKAKEHSVIFTGMNGIEMNGHHKNIGFEADIATTMK